MGELFCFFSVFLWGWGSCFVFYGFPLGVGELFCFLWFSFGGGGVVLFFMVFLWGWGSCFVFYGFPLGVGELFCFFLCFFNTVNGKLIFYRLNKLIRSARKILFVCLMVFNTTFNNISVISWRSVLLMEETGVPRKKPPTCRKLLTNFFS